jgi:signal transduction histidine kinase
MSKVNKPFYKLLNELEKFRLDNSQMINFAQTNIKEYSQLNKSIRELLKKNITIFTEQKVFIENTSLELQTPLAIVIAKLEMLIEKYHQNKEYAEEIADVLTILNRMKRLNVSLLLLSKIRNRQFPKTSFVNLRNVLESVIGGFEDLINYKNITIEKVGEGFPSLQMNEDLAYIMFTNLIKNAIAHNQNGGKIIVRYASEFITIANDGRESGIDIFNRYQNASVDEKSSGLGLSIVKSIADLYSINVTYCYDKLHIFTVGLKKN